MRQNSVFYFSLRGCRDRPIGHRVSWFFYLSAAYFSPNAASAITNKSKIWTSRSECALLDQIAPLVPSAVCVKRRRECRSVFSHLESPTLTGLQFIQREYHSPYILGPRIEYICFCFCALPRETRTSTTGSDKVSSGKSGCRRAAGFLALSGLRRGSVLNAVFLSGQISQLQIRMCGVTFRVLC